MFSLRNGLKQRDVHGRLCGKERDSAAKETPQTHSGRRPSAPPDGQASGRQARGAGGAPYCDGGKQPHAGGRLSRRYPRRGSYYRDAAPRLT